MKNAANILLLTSFFLLLLSCAKKMLPPSPDRFAPGLEQIQPINRIRIDLTFNEDINPALLNVQNFLITTPDADTLIIRNVSVRKNVVSLFTEPTEPMLYYISGQVQDKFGNHARINKKFMASAFVDIIAPKISTINPSLGTTNKTRNIFIEFNFSEPVDTSSPIRFFTIDLDTNKIKHVWSGDWQKLTFSYAESLLPNTTAYFILAPMIKDLENNYLRNYGYTFFTSDSNLAPILITGNLLYQDQPFKNGIVLFSNSIKKALTLSDVTGKFSLRLDTAIYNITAIADTNFDNQVDLIAELKEFNSTDINKIKLNLEPVLENKYIDQYLR